MTVDYLQPRRPDILEVISNLSNDEVFTPPKVANSVLDLLPPDVWSDSTLRWLDPGCKTGIFSREITKRLMVGLADEFPDEAKRLEHILKNMVFAIAITELTGMISRRTLYCSKDASGEFSAVHFNNPNGNIWHERTDHSYNNEGRCVECKGSEAQLEIPGRDNYAYGFIHKNGREEIEKEMKMKFDVIVGNPPYQMSGGGGGTNDTPLYNLFVDQARSLNPRYISMIIPSRWMAGGRGLDEFRSSMLKDQRISHLVDFPDAGELFPGVDIEGGVCYFLWDREYNGACKVTLVRGSDRHGPLERDLSEYDIFIRDSRALDILHKVRKRKEPTLENMISGDTPFGLASNFTGYSNKESVGKIKLYMNLNGKRVEKWIPLERVSKNMLLIDTWKVLLPKAHGGQKLPDVVLGKPIIAPPPSVCTQTYLVAGPLDSDEAAQSLGSYVHTRFFRFLLSLRKITQDALRLTYSWVPQQTWDRTWTDAELYKKYGIIKDEQAYIESMIKEMPE